MDLEAQNEALLLKHLDKFYNRKEISWVDLIWNSHYQNNLVLHAENDKGSFWWRDLLHLCDKFRGIAKRTVGNGTSVLFWLDVWNDQYLKDSLPRLFSFAKNQKISVAQFLSEENMDNNFYLPLSQQDNDEYQQLREIIHSLQVHDEQKDQWTYIWGSSKYTSKKMYNLPYKFIQPPKPFIWIWDSKCANKLKVFSWLMLVDRLNTRNILRRKKHNIQGNDYSCAICTQQQEETAFHLFFDCIFSRQCWHRLGIHWNNSLPFFQMMEEAKINFAHPFFMEAVIIATWIIWKTRNAKNFEQQQPSLQRWKRAFRDESFLQAHRMKEDLKTPFLTWVDSVS